MSFKYIIRPRRYHGYGHVFCSLYITRVCVCVTLFTYYYYLFFSPAATSARSRTSESAGRVGRQRRAWRLGSKIELSTLATAAADMPCGLAAGLRLSHATCTFTIQIYVCLYIISGDFFPLLQNIIYT